MRRKIRTLLSLGIWWPNHEAAGFSYSLMLWPAVTEMLNNAGLWLPNALRFQMQSPIWKDNGVYD